MNIWILIAVAFFSWWFGFIMAGILASAKLSDEYISRENENNPREEDQ